MGRATIELMLPTSVNASPARGGRGAGMARHRAKKAREAEIATLLLAAGVPRPIPGGRVRATAVVRTPTKRRRDEGNFRAPIEKPLGDALSPFDRESPFRWLPDDQPPAFTFGAVTFEHAPEVGLSVAEVTLVWAEDLVAAIEAELAELQAALDAPLFPCAACGAGAGEPHRELCAA